MHKFINTFYLKTYMYKFINTFYLKTYSYWDWGWISTACSPHDLPPTAQLHCCLGHTAGEIVAVHRDEQVCEELLAHLQHNLHDNVARLAVRLLPLPTDWTKLLQTRQDHADPVGVLDILGLGTAIDEYFRDAWHEQLTRPGRWLLEYLHLLLPGPFPVFQWRIRGLKKARSYNQPYYHFPNAKERIHGSLIAHNKYNHHC